MQWRFGCCAFLFGAGGVPLASQAISPIAVGRLARLDVLCAADTQRPCERIVGRVEAWNADSLTLRLDARDTRRVAWMDVREVALDNGTRGHAGTGFLIGTGVGILAGVLARSDCLKGAGEYGGLCDLSYLVTVPAGALLGTIIGAVARTPKWEVVPIPAARAVGAIRLPIRFGLAVRLPL
jgi:hypothetical protein